MCGALPLALGMAGLAHAEGSLQVRFYSVPPPLEWLDSVSVSGHYQTSPGPSSTVLDLSAERSLMNFGVRYNRPHHAFQAAGRRSADVAAGRTDTSATVVYTFVPQAPPEGLTVTSATVLYTLSSSQTPTYGYQSHTAGVGVGVRLSRELNLTTNATATAVLLPALGDPIWSSSVSGALTYARGGTVAYLVPGFSVQAGVARLNVTSGASLRLRPDLSASGAASWSAGAAPSANAALTYVRGPWQVSGTAATSGTGLSLGAGARVTLPQQLALGTAVSVIPATRTPVYSADISKQVGGVRVGASATLTAPPQAAPALTLQTSIVGQQKPWQGGVNVSYSRTGDRSGGNASGTLAYNSGQFGAQLALGLNLSSAATGPSLLTGRGDLTLNYAVTSRLDASASARYERSTATTAAASYRYGLGLGYRFLPKESP
ncbi:hypothetical protein [Deinococcus hopiensis]|uniref:hypothetical protein n=1 Tax=Deinococcus hopiensis TaxID=309885 RepID=UPI0009FD9D26|nr:hypothetical protein [Deinococcus hopiensis]